MIAAIDCDLHKHYCVNNAGEVLANADPGWAWLTATPGDVILFEIASPLDYTPENAKGAKAVAYNKRKWTIYNVAQAVRLQQWYGDRFLVAPSHKWTRGFDLKTRHAMAKCTHKNKDLREAQAMIWFYKQRPQDWIPLPQFLEEL